jgi:hypothetical protein
MKATHCWQVDGAWRVGSGLAGCCFEEHYESVSESRAILAQNGLRLMQHYHTGKIEAVPVAWLKELPKEIPTP